MVETPVVVALDESARGAGAMKATAEDARRTWTQSNGTSGGERSRLE